jgi:hypothetical protein
MFMRCQSIWPKAFQLGINEIPTSGRSDRHPPGESRKMEFEIRRSLCDSDGKGMVGCLAFIVLFGIAIFVSIAIVPIYYANFTLESDIKTEVSRAGAHYLDDEVITKDILEMAKKNEIQIEKKNIKLRRFAGQIFIEVNYDVPVDFGVLERNLKFQIKASSIIGTL